jgi:hypothetical protein
MKNKVGKFVEGSGCSLFEDTPRHLCTETEKNRIKPRNHRIQSTGVNSWTAAFRFSEAM